MVKADRKPATAGEAPIVPFRVHFEDGTIVAAPATSAAEARKKAEAKHDGIIRRVKVDRSGNHG